MAPSQPASPARPGTSHRRRQLRGGRLHAYTPRGNTLLYGIGLALHTTIARAFGDLPLLVVDGLLDDQATRWLTLAAVGVLALAVAAVTYRRTVTRRRRLELRDDAAEAIEHLLTSPLPPPPSAGDDAAADEIHQHTHDVDTALRELDRLSRSETAASALALRHHAVELGRLLEARQRREGEPHLLDVRITELRERVRGARDRLNAAVGR